MILECIYTSAIIQTPMGATLDTQIGIITLSEYNILCDTKGYIELPWGFDDQIRKCLGNRVVDFQELQSHVSMRQYKRIRESICNSTTVDRLSEIGLDLSDNWDNYGFCENQVDSLQYKIEWKFNKLAE